MEEKKYSILGEKRTEKSTVEIEVEIDSGTLFKFRKKALNKLSEKADIPGFRKGHIPESILVNKIGEMGILEEAAEEAINEIVPLILAEKKINFITQPHISITAIALGNPLRFKIKTEYLPEITLPDYKKIAAEKNKKTEPAPEVSEKELGDAIEQIRKIASQQFKMKEGELPEMNDEFAKKLGGFESVAKLKEKLKADMLKEKEMRLKEKKRIDIAEAILSEVKAEMPETLIGYELDRMQAQFEGDLSNMGLKLEDYLAKVSKKIGDLKKGWEKDAERRAKLEIIVYKIAAEEKIAPSEEEVKKETDHLMKHNKDVNKQAAERYIERALINQKVFEFLERQ